MVCIFESTSHFWVVIITMEQSDNTSIWTVNVYVFSFLLPLFLLFFFSYFPFSLPNPPPPPSFSALLLPSHLPNDIRSPEYSLFCPQMLFCLREGQVEDKFLSTSDLGLSKIEWWGSPRRSKSSLDSRGKVPKPEELWRKRGCQTLGGKPRN